MAENTVPVGATNIGAVDKGSVLYQKMVDFDPDFGRAQGSTFYRERLGASSYTIHADSIADGLAAFWTSAVANGGTTGSTAGEGLLQTSTAANGSAQLVSTAPPYFPGQQAWMRTAARFGDTGTVGNVRRIGAFTVSGTTPQDGFAFELSDTTLSAVSYKAGVATATAMASWSNATAMPFTLDANYHLFEIRWTANAASFYIDNEFRHSTSALATSITTTLNLPMAVQNIKTSGAVNQVLAIRNIGLGRFGIPSTDPYQDTYYRGRGASFRMIGRAGTTPRRLIALWNAAGSGRTVHIKQMTCDILQTAVMAVTVIPPVIRAYRITAIPTNGTALTKVAKDTGGMASASVTLFQDASADGTNSAAALAATVTAGAHLTQEFAPRLITAVGYEMFDRTELLADQEVIIRPGEGIVLSYDGIAAATQEPATTHTIASIDWYETA